MVSAYAVPTAKNADKELIVVGCYAGNSLLVIQKAFKAHLISIATLQL